jgi:flagellar P-ring protein precursor FlgI
MGVQISPTSVRVNNIAAVFVTSSLPAFARPGMTLDVTVSSIGDAKSLQGGVLLLTSLHGVDGQVYADAQGPLTIGGYSVTSGSNAKQVNHNTVGRIASGAIVERDTAVDLSRMKTVSLMLREPDFSAARDVAAAVNQSFGKEIASALDSRRIDVDVATSGLSSVPALIARVQELPVRVHPPAKVVINERTGTIVMGGDVRLSPVSVLHGSLSIDVSTAFGVSQPNPLSKGETVVVPDTAIQANAAPARSIKLADGASVDQLISGLQAIGATARDIVAILQAIKAAGGLQAELEVL